MAGRRSFPELKNTGKGLCYYLNDKKRFADILRKDFSGCQILTIVLEFIYEFLCYGGRINEQ